MKYLGCKKAKGSELKTVLSDYFNSRAVDITQWQNGICDPFSGSGFAALNLGQLASWHNGKLTHRTPMFISDHYYPAYLLSKGLLLPLSVGKAGQDFLLDTIEQINKQKISMTLTFFDVFFLHQYAKTVPFFTEAQICQILTIKKKIEAFNYHFNVRHSYLTANDVKECMLGLLLHKMLKIANIRTGFDVALGVYTYSNEIVTLELPKLKTENSFLATSINYQCVDAIKAVERGGDFLFLDPPSSYKQYGRLYHVLDTLLAGKVKPILTINSGYIHHSSTPSSVWNSKIKSEKVLNTILSQCQFDYVAMTYPKKGLMNNNNIEKAFVEHCKKGSVEIKELGNEQIYIGKIKKSRPKLD